MPSRRRFIGGCAGFGALALAGCTGVMNDGDESGTTSWHYDAGARFGASTVGAATVDVAAVREAPLPEEFRNQLQSVDEEVESVDLEDVDSVAATGFLDRSDGLFGGSVVVLGEFDPEALRKELEKESPQPVESPEGWDRYAFEHQDGGLAVREDAIVYGIVEAQGETDADPVGAAIAAGAGDAAPFADRKNGETLRAELSGDVTVAVDLGSEWRRELESGFGSRDDALGTIVGAAQAFGLDATFGEETTDLTYVVIADPEELDVETVRGFVEQARSSEGTSFGEVSVSRDGRAIVASTSVATGALLNSHESVLSGGSRGVERTAPNVSFEAERTDDGRVRLTHRAGDSLDAVEVVYDGVGGRRREIWTGDPISAGDTHVTGEAVADGGSVTVVWRSEDGSQASTLFQASF